MARTRIRAVDGTMDARTFVELPYRLHRNDPRWVAPLRGTERARWSARHNRSLARLAVGRFLAERDGRVTGRIAAVIDPAFQRWDPGAGFFGFLECEPDADAARQLLAAAEAFLRERGMASVFGPVNLTTHEETGLLVEGFHSPTVLEPWNPGWYEDLVIAAGYLPHRRYGAWEWTPASVAGPAVRRIARTLRGDHYGTIRIRPFDPGRFDDEVDRLCTLYNEAFCDVWGFVSISPREFRERAAGFRPFYRPDLVLLALAGDEPVGFALVLPDINEALQGLGGRLLPFGWLSLPGRIRRIRTGRFILMAVRPDHAGRAIAAALALRLGETVRGAGFQRIEVSLVQEDNRPMVRVIEGLGCVRTRTWVLFRKLL